MPHQEAQRRAGEWMGTPGEEVMALLFAVATRCEVSVVAFLALTLPTLRRSMHPQGLRTD